MNKKPGFQVKVGGETIVYIVIIILIFGFILFMPNIYKFISNLKSGNLFNRNTSIVENNKQNNEIDNNKEQNVIVSDANLVCVQSKSTPEGNLVDKYTFYYNDNKLEKLENEKNYDAIADEYLNYVYSEQARFNNMNNLYKEVSGFSYTSELESRMLKATFSYDLTVLNLDDLYNSDENLSVQLNVTRNQSLEETKNTYEGLGYNCR